VFVLKLPRLENLSKPSFYTKDAAHSFFEGGFRLRFSNDASRRTMPEESRMLIGERLEKVICLGSRTLTKFQKK
jgi:hypothetical protein